MSAIARTVRRINQFLHLLASLLLVSLMLLTVADVVSRRLWNQPFGWTVELTQLAMVLIVYLALGYAEHEGDHISLDLVYTRLSARVQRILLMFDSLAGVTVMAFIAWALVSYANVLDSGGYVTSVLGIPLRPIALLAAGGSLLFCVAMVITLMKAARHGGGTQ